MIWLAAFFFYLLATSGDVNASSSLLLSPCDSDVDCFPVRGNCVKVAETCGHGVCMCVAPFIATASGYCRRGITPWRHCNFQAGDVCVGKNFQCIDGQCQCRPGLYPFGDSCVQTVRGGLLSFGLTCSDDSNCLPGMECRPWIPSDSGDAGHKKSDDTICQCPTTHRLINNTQCFPRRLGDPCSGSDAECGLILDAICSLDTMTCSCPLTHQATQTLHNTMPLPIADGFTTAWQLVDACRPINGATKRIGQRCTNSLQCQHGHICARCEPKNLNLPKTCNRPACSSLMCRNQTCPLCKDYYDKERSTSTTTTTTSTTASITITTTLPLTTMSTEEPTHDEEPVESERFVPPPQQNFTTNTQLIVEQTEVQSNVNVILAVTLPLVFLGLAVVCIVVFVRYAWGRLNWRRRAIKCVEALETESSSASSGLSVNRHQYSSSGMDSATNSTNITNNTIAPLGMSDNIHNFSTFYGTSNSVSAECAYATQTSANMLIRALEDELQQAGAANSCNNGGDNNNNGAFSALTLNYKTSNLVNNRSKQHLMSRSSCYLHQLPASDNSVRSSDSACPRHKYCFNTNAMEDMMTEDDYVASSDVPPPRLPHRTRSIRAFGVNKGSYYNDDDDQQSVPQAWTATLGPSLVSSRHTDIDRRKSLQY